MIINLSYHRKQALRSLDKGHPYYGHASSALEENLQQVRICSPMPFQKNVVSLIHNRSQMGGNGILLNKEGFILTSLHLVDHLQRDRYQMRDYIIRDTKKRESSLDQSFFAWDKDYDLAILRTLKSADDLLTIPLGVRYPKPDERVIYFPFPNGRESLALDGVVEDPSCDIEIIKDEDTPKLLRRNSFIFTGKGDINYSGSSIFSHKGELLGTLFGGEIPGRNSTLFAINVIYARRLVQYIRRNLHDY